MLVVVPYAFNHRLKCHLRATSRAKPLKSSNIHDLKHHPGKYQVLYGHAGMSCTKNGMIRYVLLTAWVSLFVDGDPWPVLENLPWILSFWCLRHLSLLGRINDDDATWSTYICTRWWDSVSIKRLLFIQLSYGAIDEASNLCSPWHTWFCSSVLNH